MFAVNILLVNNLELVQRLLRQLFGSDSLGIPSSRHGSEKCESTGKTATSKSQSKFMELELAQAELLIL